MIETLKRVIAELGKQEGQTLAEYGLVLAFVATTCIIALVTLGGQILTPIQNVIAGFGS